jgi:hypothetical protein
MPDFETRLKDVSHAAWLIWTANGLGLDDLGLEQTSKSATDAANNAYVEGISAKDWVDDTLMRMRQRLGRCAMILTGGLCRIWASCQATVRVRWNGRRRHALPYGLSGPKIFRSLACHRAANNIRSAGRQVTRISGSS